MEHNIPTYFCKKKAKFRLKKFNPSKYPSLLFNQRNLIVNAAAIEFYSLKIVDSLYLTVQIIATKNM